MKSTTTIFAVALLLSAAAYALPHVVSRAEAGHREASSAGGASAGQPRVSPLVGSTASERHAAYATPAVSVIHVPAPIRKNCDRHATPGGLR